MLWLMRKTKGKLVRVSSKRRKVANYFTKVIVALIEKKELLKLVNVENKIQNERLLKATNELINLYK